MNPKLSHTLSPATLRGAAATNNVWSDLLARAGGDRRRAKAMLAADPAALANLACSVPHDSAITTRLAAPSPARDAERPTPTPAPTWAYARTLADLARDGGAAAYDSDTDRVRRLLAERYRLSGEKLEIQTTSQMKALRRLGVSVQDFERSQSKP